MNTLETLERFFSHTTFRGEQESVIESVLRGNDVAVFWTTGGGKSLCYQLPALHRGNAYFSIIVSPLLALMHDQTTQVNARNPGMAIGLSAQSPRTTVDDALNGRYPLVYTTPEKLLAGDFLLRLRTVVERVTLIAIDEAHCVSQWGHDFRPVYRELGQIRAHLPEVPIMALTATALPRVRADIIETLNLRNVFVSSGTFDRPNLRIRVARKSVSDLLRELSCPKGSTIVYVPSQREAEDIAALARAHIGKELKEEDEVLHYHAGLTSSERDEAHRAFTAGTCRIMVATVAFGMGIDKPDVRRVVHFGPPQSIEQYFQEIGRAGRDGLPSECTLLTNDSEFTKYQGDFYTKALSTEVRNDRMRSLNVLRDFCATGGVCRRVQLLAYFGEAVGKCGQCDTCQVGNSRDYSLKAALLFETIARLAPGAMTKILKMAMTSADPFVSARRATARPCHSQQLRDMIPALVAGGYLQRESKMFRATDFSRAYDVYGVTALAQAVLDGTGGRVVL